MPAPALVINNLNFQRTRSTKPGWGARLFRGAKSKTITSTGLKDVSLTIPNACLVVVSGGNGSGKTTLLNTIAGLFGKKAGASGEIRFAGGQNLLDMSAEEQLLWKNQRIAYMTQSTQLDRGLTVLQNIALPLFIRGGITREEAYAKARDKLREVGLERYAKTFPEDLSGGMAQRVALARMLAQEADILLLDEPTANTDEASTAKIKEVLKEQYQKGKLVILVTHDEEMIDNPDFYHVKMEEGQIAKDFRGKVEVKEARSHYTLKSKGELARPTLGKRARASLNLLLLAMAKSVSRPNRWRSLGAALSPALGVAGVDLALVLEKNGIIPDYDHNVAALKGEVSITDPQYNVEGQSDDPLDHKLERGRIAGLASTLEEKPAVHPRLQGVCEIEVNGKTRGMPLWAIEESDPLPLASQLIAGTFSLRGGEIILGEQEAKKLGLSAESIGRELTVRFYPPGEGLKYFTVKLSGIVSGNVNLAGAAFVPIEFVQEQLGITRDQAPNFILSFSRPGQAGAAAEKLKQAAPDLAISAYSTDKTYLATKAYLTFVELQLVTTIFLAAVLFQLYVNAKQMTGQEESEIALRGLLGSSRRATFGEYFGTMMALYGLGTLSSMAAFKYGPINYEETHGITFLGPVLNAIGVDWNIPTKTPWSDLCLGAGAVGLLAGAASALALRSGQARQRASTPLSNYERVSSVCNWSRHWSILNLCRNMARNRLTMLVPSAAFFYTLFDTFQYGMLHDARNNLAWTTTPELMVTRSENPNDPLNFAFLPFPLAGVPGIDGESARTARVTLKAELSQPRSARTEMLIAYGIDPQTDSRVFPRIAKEISRGGYIKTRGGIILPKRTAQHLGVEVGSEVNLTAQTEGCPPNALELKVAGTYESANPNTNANTAYIALADAQAMMGLAVGEVTEVDFSLGSFKEAARAAQRLRAAHPEFQFHDFLSRSQTIGDWEAGANWLQGIFCSMLFLVGSYGAYSFVSSNLNGRRREIYDMQANGLTLRQIRQIINREMTLAAACGGCVFTSVGILASYVLEKCGLNLSTFSSEQGIMGLPISLNEIHGHLSYLTAVLAGAAASLAPSIALRAKSNSLVRPAKEPYHAPFRMTGEELASFPVLSLESKIVQMLGKANRTPFVLEPDETSVPDAEPLDEKPAISVRGLTVAYSSEEGSEVLNVPNFSVKKGEYVVITGGNGAAKTTLLEAIAAAFIPTKSRITVRNQGEEIQVDQLADDAARAKYRSELAIIPQNLGLFEDLTVEENIYFGLRGNSLYESYQMPEEIRAMVNSAIRELEIEGMRKVKVSQLSGGQRQRVAIARALAKSPEILLIDEATANLDHESKEKFRDLVSRLNNTKKITVVFVSHDELITKQNDVRVVKLVKGQIVN